MHMQNEAAREAGVPMIHEPRDEAPSQPADLLALAISKGADIETIERLLALKERVDAKQAEQAFNAALNRCQAAMGRIATNRDNKQTNSRYADYAALDRVLRPLYTAEGFSLSFDTGAASDASVLVLCHVSHSQGHTRTYRIEMPADGKGAKGGDVMTKTHATGSATAYGMRYLLKMIFNVAIGEADDDGNGATKGQPKCVSADEALELEDLAKIAKADVPAFLSLLDNAETFADIWAKDYKRAKAMLNQKIKKMEKDGVL